MRRYILCAVLLLVLIVINVSVVQKEQLLREGKTYLLRLEPVDPRSLMQGDYMVLRYQIARDVNRDELHDRGRLVVRLDENNVAHYVRIDNDQPLGKCEHVLFYRKRGGLRLGAESFFFQEGHAERYVEAVYGELKVDPNGHSVLIGLRDETFSPLGQEPDPE